MKFLASANTADVAVRSILCFTMAKPTATGITAISEILQKFTRLFNLEL
jgi:hypothetical protein